MARMWLLIAAALPVIATAAPAESEALHWRDVLAAIDRDPRFAAARAASNGARAGIGVASAVPNPELDATLGRGKAREGDAERTEWEVSLKFPLQWLVRRGPQIAAAAGEADGAAADAAALRREVTAELRRLYVEATFAQELAAALGTSEEQVSTLASLVRRRVESGEARPVELPRIEVELERVRGERAHAAAERDAALAQLSTWLGRPVARVELPPATPPSKATGEEAPPRVRAADARLAAARAEVEAARRERIPALAVGAFYASELDRRAAGVTLSTELPLWNWNGPQIARAAARADAEAARAEATRREVAAAAALARSACERSAGEADRQATRIVPRAEESARTLERSFELGEANLIDVLDARRVLLDARCAALGSARQREVDCGTSLILAGMEIP